MLDFLAIQDKIRTFSKQRTATHSACFSEDFYLYTASKRDQPSVYLSFKKDISRALLESPFTSAYNFASYFTRKNPDSLLSFFSKHSPAFIIPRREHEQSRKKMLRSLNSLIDNIGPSTYADILCGALEQTGNNVYLASSISAFQILNCWFKALFSRTMSAECLEKLETINFFFAFPSPSKLQKCENNLNFIIKDLSGNETLDEDNLLIALTFLLMGFKPIKAMLNHFTSSALQASAHGSTLIPETINYSDILPTNFVIRQADKSFPLGDQAIQQGTIFILYLADAQARCPFSSLTAIPFGAGRHKCAGLALSEHLRRSLIRHASPKLSDLAKSVSPESIVFPSYDQNSEVFLSFLNGADAN